jgi:peptidoglycan/LPS O-acetylase OafA/YrhL
MNKTYHEPSIDGLRAIAVAAVIIFHLDPKWLPGGFSGVDVFFVISGFVVSASTQEWHGISLGNFLLRFYSRRFLRIVPALTVCLIVTALLAALFIPHSWLSDTSPRTGRFAFFGASNFILAKTASDYFSPITDFNPYTHTWSLGVEEQFYVIFPVLFIFWLRERRFISTTLYAAGVVSSIACAWWLVKTNPTAAFYMPWSRFWQLGAGVLLYQSMSARGHSFSGPSNEKKYFNLGATLSLVVLLIGLWVSSPEASPFPGGGLPVLGTLGVLGFLHGRSHGAMARALTLPAMKFLGKISYSLYLWHWPIIVLFRWTIGIDSTGSRLGAAALTAIAATFSWYFIENPFRRKVFYSRKFLGIAVGAGLIGIGVFTSRVILDQQPRISRSVVEKHTDDWQLNRVRLDPAMPGCTLDQKFDLRAITGGMIWHISRTGCASARTFAGNIYVLGDSHAMAYMTMFQWFLLATGAEVFSYSRAGCGFINLHDLPDQCVQYTKDIIEDVSSKIREGDIVFLASLRLGRFTDQWIDFGTSNSEKFIFGLQGIEGRRLGEMEAAPVLKRFTDKGAIVIFAAPTPLFQYVPFRCSDWFNNSNPICKHGPLMSRDFLETLRKPVLESMNRLAQNNDRVYVWDPFPILCPESSCSPYKDGRPLFFDGDHLSGYGNRIAAPGFETFIREIKGVRSSGGRCGSEG